MAKRASGGFDKKIFGVPVFPVAKTPSNGHHGNEHNVEHVNGSNNSFNNNNNHQQQHLRNSNILEKSDLDGHKHTNNTPISHYPYNPNSHYIHSPINLYPHSPSNHTPYKDVSSNQYSYKDVPSNQWKLRHVDFMPVCVRGKKEDEYERFSALMDKANKWLLSNNHVMVFSCETVTWTSVDRPVYSDGGVMLRSMTSDRKTKFCRGLRLWYFVLEEVFYMAGGGEGGRRDSREAGLSKLGHVTYTCEGGKGDMSFSHLIKKLNSDLTRKAIKGRILRVETLEVLSDITDVDTCVWHEQADKAKDYTWFLRLLIACDPEEAYGGEIGVHDFIPVQLHRNPHNSGYETYEDLWNRASQHLFQNPQLTFLSAQSIFVKVKKDTETRGVTLWDKCTHCQHASSYGGLSNQRTEFLQVLRLSFYKTCSLSPSSITPSFGKKYFYKSFSVGAMKRAILPPTMSPSDDQDPLSVDCLYEDLKTLEDRANAWLASSGAKVAGVETLTSRLASGGQEMLSSEATSVYNQRERNLTKEPWKVTVRLVLEGECRERGQGCEPHNTDAGGIRSDF